MDKPPQPSDAFVLAEEVLRDCRKYLTEFGSIEPSGLVRRIETTLRDMREETEQRSYLWQLDTINRSRAEEGKPPLTLSQFMAGGSNG